MSVDHEPHDRRCTNWTNWAPGGPTLRLQIGLEDIEDLKADLAAGFKRLAPCTPIAEPG